MRQIWLLAMALAMLPNHSLAQEPSDCVLFYEKNDNSQGCDTYSEFPPSVLKRDRLHNIGALGSAGRVRTTYVLELLKDENWDVRAEAARTLRLTGETLAVPDLIDAIRPRDWKLTFEAMNSLKKLRAPEADQILEDVARTYWHPAIANAADDLLRGKIAPGQARSILDGDVMRRFCEASADQTILPRCSLDKDDPQDIRRFNQEHQDYTQRFVADFRNIQILRDARRLGHSLKTIEGEFTGTDNGEFGGELVFTNGATRQTILNENILALAKQGNRIIVVTGLNHMITDKGYILEITRGSEDSWEAKRLWRLPGAPSHVLMAPGGTIGLHGSFGSVLYKTDDTLQWLACGESYSCRR